MAVVYTIPGLPSATTDENVDEYVLNQALLICTGFANTPQRRTADYDFSSSDLTSKIGHGTFVAPSKTQTIFGQETAFGGLRTNDDASLILLPRLVVVKTTVTVSADPNLTLDMIMKSIRTHQRLWYPSVTAGVPSSDTISKLIRGNARIYG